MSGFYPNSGFFRIFFKSPCSLDYSLQLLLNKLCHILIPLGGDRASICYVVTEGKKETHNFGDLYINKVLAHTTKQHLALILCKKIW